MPQRLLHLRFYQRHRDAIGYLLLWLAIGFIMWAQYDTTNANHAQSVRADQRFARLTEQNRRLILQARRQAAVSAQTAYAACRRLQEQTAIQRELNLIVIPRLAPDPTPEQKAALTKYQRDLAAHNILTVPVCVRPTEKP